MTFQSSAHLTDDQFTQCVLTVPSAACREHLAHCEICTKELQRFSNSMQDFSAAALGWSEAQSYVSLRGAVKAHDRKPLFVAAGWALATGLVVSVALPMMTRHDQPVSVTGQATAADATGDSPEQIAKDNEMMRSVDVAISTKDRSPFEEYRLQDVRQTRGKTRVESRNE